MSNNHMIQQEPDVQAEPTVKEKHILLSFIRERPILTVLFGLSLLLLLVDSGLIFYVPDDDWEKVARLIDIFAGAYVTGILMLLLVEEVPRAQRRQKAMLAEFPLVRHLHNDMNILAEMLRCSAEGKPMDELYFTNHAVYVRVRLSQGGFMNDVYNLSDCSRTMALNIQRLLSEFSLTPLSRDCDEELLEMFSELKADRVLAIILPRPENFGPIKGLSETYNLLLYSLDVIENLYEGMKRHVYSVMKEDQAKQLEEYRKKIRPAVDAFVKQAHDEAMRREPV